MGAPPTARAAVLDAIDDLGPHLAEQYGLGGIHDLRVLPVTGRNVNVVLTDAHSATYVARCYLRNPDRARVRFQLDFQKHLRSEGVPVPGIVPTLSGSEIAMIANASWVLFEYVPGSSYDPANAKELRSAARWLNALHEAGRTFAGAEVGDDTIPDLRRWWARGSDDIRELRAMFAGRGVEDELDFLSEWHECLTYEMPIEAVDELPTAWLHADFHGSNLAFSDGEVTGIFDFDVVHHAWRLDDIARSVYYFAPEGAGSDAIGSEPVSTFTDAFGLTDLERAALPAFRVAVHARTPARYRIREREGSDAAVTLRKHVARMRRIQDQVR